MNKKNNLFIVPVRICSIGSEGCETIYFVYEMTKKGQLRQKHGSNLEGAPFSTRADAIKWAKEQVETGGFLLIGT